MIYTGLASIALRKLSTDEIISIVQKCGLKAIEWGGDVHVPHGNISKARDVREKTIEAGLKISSYGSYYSIGESEGEGLTFEKVLETGLELGVRTIRVWPGNKKSEETTPADIKTIVEESIRIGAIARRENVTLAYEYHPGTFTNTNESALKLVREVNLENVRTYWQSAWIPDVEKTLAELSAIIDFVVNVHMFCWVTTAAGREWRLLEDGQDEIRKYFKVLRSQKRDFHALIEHVKDDRPENLLADAETLKRLAEEK